MIPLSKGKTDCKDGFTFILIPQCFQGCQTIIQQQILIQQILTGVSTQRQETPQAVYRGAGYAAVSAWSFDWSPHPQSEQQA